MTPDTTEEQVEVFFYLFFRLIAQSRDETTPLPHMSI